MSEVAATSRGPTTPLDGPPPTGSRWPLAGGLLVVAELAVGWFTIDIDRWLADHTSLFTDSPRLFSWLVMILPFVPLALVAAVAARWPLRGLSAATVGLAAGAVGIGYYELIQFMFTQGHVPTFDVVRILGYADQMAIAALATLAWGLSRRQGRLWPLGAVVAAIGAALTVWTNWQNDVGWSSFSNVVTPADIRREYLLHTVALLLPIVVGCLTSWVVERLEHTAHARALSP